MSTVGAAIIDYINHGGMGGFDAGVGIVFDDRNISVDFDPATMEINAHGQLAAKITGGSSGGGGSSIIYTGGPGISVDAYNKISAVYNPNTIEIIDGAISAKVSESGGVSTDVGIVIDQVNIGSSSLDRIYVRDIDNENDVGTGMLLNMKNRNTGNVDRFVLVRTSLTTLNTFDEKGEHSIITKNAILYPLFDGGTAYDAKIYSDDGKLTFIIQIDGIKDGTYETLASETVFMRPVQLTTRTLSAITFVNNNLLRNWQSLLNYFEKTVEALKKKVGI